MSSIGSSNEDEVENLEGWEDIEPDLEYTKVVSLFDDTVHDDVQSMLQHCKDTYRFDIAKVQNDLNLDHLQMIKLVNYVRQESKSGDGSLNLSEKSAFEDDKYLHPVLEDDPLLYSLEDIIEGDLHISEEPLLKASRIGNTDPHTETSLQLSELQQTLLQTQESLKFSNQRLELAQRALDTQKNYQNEMGAGLSVAAAAEENDRRFLSPRLPDQPKAKQIVSSNYDEHGLHRIMLEDKARTSSYQKFILGNKHLFEGKVVLDVGCGTGILSMFCADAGAKLVIAVDQSEVLHIAQENVFKNGYQTIIRCLKGRIEEVNLGVDKVDIIVSEWMGYCLLFEQMLDSVIWARDKYLADGGLMVPSHTTLRIAPLAYPVYVLERLGFWRNPVYGYDMKSMCNSIYPQVDTDQRIGPEHAFAESKPFLSLPLATVKISDLEFAQHEFILDVNKDVGALDGFAIWFDTFFLKPGEGPMPAYVKAEHFEDFVRGSDSDRVLTRAIKEEGFECFVRPTASSVAFTTGPYGPPTHWNQGLVLINRAGMPSFPLGPGYIVCGSVRYSKQGAALEGLNIQIQWGIFNVNTVNEVGSLERGNHWWKLH